MATESRSQASPNRQIVLTEFCLLSVLILCNDMVTPPPQVQAGPLPDCGASLHQDAAKQAEPPHTDAPAKVSDLCPL